MSDSRSQRLRRSSIIALGMFMLFYTLSGNLQAANEATINAQKLITEAKAAAPLISVSELNELMESETPFGLIDIRSENEYQTGYLKGAELITRSVLEFVVMTGGLGEDDRKIVLYCRSGNRSALALKTMLDLGFTDVRHLDGGIRAWVEAKMPCYDSQGKIMVIDSEPEQ